VRCAAADRGGRTSTLSFTVWVTFDAPHDGSFFLFPIREDGLSAFWLGSPIPVRFRLAGPSAAITNLRASLRVTKISDVPRAIAAIDSSESGEDIDLAFHFLPILRFYWTRWRTRGLTRGTYRLDVDLGDGVVHENTVSLVNGR
jgi:hypothetical protein